MLLLCAQFCYQYTCNRRKQSPCLVQSAEEVGCPDHGVPSIFCSGRPVVLSPSQVRKVNDKLFVGLGYIQAFGGKYNSAPFVLEGPPVHPFTAPDATK